MDALIAYWKAKLDDNRWMMSHEDRIMVEQTLKALKAFKKSKSVLRVEREADIVRTVKQLETVKAKHE